METKDGLMAKGIVRRFEGNATKALSSNERSFLQRAERFQLAHTDEHTGCECREEVGHEESCAWRILDMDRIGPASVAELAAEIDAFATEAAVAHGLPCPFCASTLSRLNSERPAGHGDECLVSHGRRLFPGKVPYQGQRNT